LAESLRQKDRVLVPVSGIGHPVFEALRDQRCSFFGDFIIRRRKST
jgi:hypothetical protein